MIIAEWLKRRLASSVGEEVEEGRPAAPSAPAGKKTINKPTTSSEEDQRLSLEDLYSDAMDDVEDKSGAQIRIATEVCTVVVFVCFTAIWVGATIAVGRALSKEFENSTVIIVCFLVGCFVGFWFLQIGFSIYAPAWLDVSASRGVKKGNDTPALKAWRADAPVRSELAAPAPAGRKPRKRGRRAVEKSPFDDFLVVDPSPQRTTVAVAAVVYMLVPS